MTRLVSHFQLIWTPWRSDKDHYKSCCCIQFGSMVLYFCGASKKYQIGPFLISWLPGLVQKVIKSLKPPNYMSTLFKHLYAKCDDDDPAQWTSCKAYIFKIFQQRKQFFWWHQVMPNFLLFSRVENFLTWSGSCAMFVANLIRGFGFTASKRSQIFINVLSKNVLLVIPFRFRI